MGPSALPSHALSPASIAANASAYPVPVSWTEADSRLYQDLAAVAVPDRAEQIAALLTLLPFGASSAARVVELGCGEGRLSAAVLHAYPRARILALDGSPEMLNTARGRLAPFGPRASVAEFDLASQDWWPMLEGADAVLSSLAIHHLDGPLKQRLFSAVGSHLQHHGALLIADLIEPQRPEAQELLAATWDESAQQQSPTPAHYEQFREAHWNLYRYPDPDVDKPSPLAHQLRWLEQAGFQAVDCFWLKAGHAIYGGYRSATRLTEEPPLPFETARAAAQQSLSD